MIEGSVSTDGVPEIVLEIAGRSWVAVIDTGFNGHVELPEELRSAFQPRYIGRGESVLAGGRMIEEDVYEIEFPFGGRTFRAQTTFVDQSPILIGTRLLSDYRLEVDFPRRSVRLRRRRRNPERGN